MMHDHTKTYRRKGKKQNLPADAHTLSLILTSSDGPNKRLNPTEELPQQDTALLSCTHRGTMSCRGNTLLEHRLNVNSVNTDNQQLNGPFYYCLTIAKRQALPKHCPLTHFTTTHYV